MTRNAFINALLTALMGLACAGIVTATGRLSDVPKLTESVKDLTSEVREVQGRVRELEIEASRDAGRRDAEQELGRRPVPNLFRKN